MLRRMLLDGVGDPLQVVRQKAAGRSPVVAVLGAVALGGVILVYSFVCHFTGGGGLRLPTSLS